MQIGLATILIVLILTGAIALAGGAYYLGTRRSETLLAPFAAPSQTPQPTFSTDETVGWRTYTDTDYFFKIDYPTRWTIKTGQSNYIFSPKGEKFLVKDLSLEDQEGEVYINIRGNFQGGFCEGGGCKEEEYTNKSGIRIKKFTATSDIYYTFSLKGNNFFVTAGPVDQSVLLDKIMSTFKLTN